MKTPRIIVAAAAFAAIGTHFEVKPGEPADLYLHWPKDET